MRDDRLYLDDILGAADLIGQFVQRHTEAEFEKNALLHSAVFHQLMVIGEAAGRISEELKAGHPDIPWREIIGFRNVIAHAYFSLNLKRAWLTATRDVPSLRERIAQISA